MIKSNSKEARRAVERYVMDYVEDICERMEYDGHRPIAAAFDALKDEMAFQDVMRGGRRVMGEGLAEKYRKAGRNGFTTANDPYWVWYLAGCVGSFEVYTDSTRRLLAEWLQETPEEAAAYGSDKVEALYLHMTSSAFERLYKKESEPHRIPTADFKYLYDERNGGHFFDRDTLRFFGETMRSFTVYGFELVEDSRGDVHDCYAVHHTITDGKYRFPKTAYFDRDTLAEVWPKEA